MTHLGNSGTMHLSTPELQTCSEEDPPLEDRQGTEDWEDREKKSGKAAAAEIDGKTRACIKQWRLHLSMLRQFCN